MIPADHPPRHRHPDDPGPELCDFCCVRSLRLAGASTYRQPRTVQVHGITVQPIRGGVMLGADTTTFQAGEWAACAACVPVVARRDPDTLAHHVLAEWVATGRVVTPLDLRQLQATYRQVLPILGPPTPAR